MICTTYDREYFEDKTCWIAELSNGVLVYQDDGRETEKEYSSWIRLKEYLKENNLNIIRLFLKFRSNVLDVIPSNKEGYFFSMGIIGMMSSNQNVNFYLIGSIENNKVKIKKIKIPELVVFDEEIRDISDCKEQQLIINQ